MNRSAPTGGAAYGMPRKWNTPVALSWNPSTFPLVVSTITGAPPPPFSHDGQAILLLVCGLLRVVFGAPVVVVVVAGPLLLCGGGAGGGDGRVSRRRILVRRVWVGALVLWIKSIHA